MLSTCSDSSRPCRPSSLHIPSSKVAELQRALHQHLANLRQQVLAPSPLLALTAATMQQQLALDQRVTTSRTVHE